MRHPFIWSLPLLLILVSLAQADDKSPLVKVQSPKGNGTGTVIITLKDKPVADGFEGYVLTAYHVVAESAKSGARNIKIAFENGRIAKECKVVASDPSSDIALIWAWIPKEVIPAKIATRNVEHNDPLLFVGLGGGIAITDEDAIRRIAGKAATPTNVKVIASGSNGVMRIDNDLLFSDTVLIPGDSGGPVFNSDSEIVGVISGGWFWFVEKSADKNSTSKKCTWPARACSTGPIRKLIEQLKIGPPIPSNG